MSTGRCMREVTQTDVGAITWQEASAGSTANHVCPSGTRGTYATRRWSVRLLLLPPPSPPLLLLCFLLLRLLLPSLALLPGLLLVSSSSSRSSSASVSSSSSSISHTSSSSSSSYSPDAEFSNRCFSSQHDLTTSTLTKTLRSLKAVGCCAYGCNRQRGSSRLKMMVVLGVSVCGWECGLLSS